MTMDRSTFNEQISFDEHFFRIRGRVSAKRKRALTSIVGDFEQFERFHTEYLEEAQAVFACVTSLRFALREFRKRVQQELTLE